MWTKMIAVPHNSGDDVFVHVPPRLNLAYLADVLSRKLGRDITIAECATTNLCANNWGGVSCSGATVLCLSLTLDGGDTLDLVAKILSPDPVNLFQIDLRFSSRLKEVAWADWWGNQDVPWVPVIYDTRADRRAREFWVIHEYFPQVGWPGFDATKPKGPGHFSADTGRLRTIMRQAALLHAYSRSRIEELRGVFPVGNGVTVDACASQTLQSWLTQAVADPSFLSGIGVSDEERASLDAFGEALAHVPEWVEQWDMVCVTGDWKQDNFGIRDGNQSELVTFDWGAARLAPMEEDVDVLLGRIKNADSAQKDDLLGYYLEVYADKTGRRIEPAAFRARIPWAYFFAHLRYLLGHVEALRWVPYQTRSRDFVHLFIGLCKKLMEKLFGDTMPPLER
ncbi:MAG: hypothetical protein JW889_11575 [Verrucomicrobia bacterium]|nr:hypothetical protein [Verrucomicrobiota bacterium]